MGEGKIRYTGKNLEDKKLGSKIEVLKKSFEKSRRELISLLVILAWIYPLLNIFSLSHNFESFGSVFLAILPPLFVLFTLIKRPSKISSIFGKILIFGGILGLVTLFVNKGGDSLSFDTMIRTGAVITGLYLERISPHKRLKDFMFLAISTKIELIGLTAFVSVLEIYRNLLIFEPFYWYLIVVLMGLSVPLLALKQLNLFRFLVWLTTFCSLVLFLDVVWSVRSTPVLFLSLLVVLWPAISARALGRRVFFNASGKE